MWRRIWLIKGKSKVSVGNKHETVYGRGNVIIGGGIQYGICNCIGKRVVCKGTLNDTIRNYIRTVNLVIL